MGGGRSPHQLLGAAQVFAMQLQANRLECRLDVVEVVW